VAVVTKRERVIDPRLLLVIALKILL